MDVTGLRTNVIDDDDFFFYFCFKILADLFARQREIKMEREREREQETETEQAPIGQFTP